MPAKALGKYAHLPGPVVDGELVKSVLAKARGFHQTKIEKDCMLVL